MLTNLPNYREISKVVRRQTGTSGWSIPIKDVDGFQAPTVEGQGCHHENKSGDIVHYPGAYRKAYGNPIYVPSTRRIIVGRGWLIQNGLV